MSDSAERYARLCNKIARFEARVSARYPKALTCHGGCSGCCHVHLSLVSIEFERIARALMTFGPAALAELRVRLERGRDDPRCPLLNDQGRCQVYAVRPVICRSHGLPVQVGEPPSRDVCPLNFSAGPALEELEAEVVLDVERVNTVLGLIDRLAGGHGERIDLLEGLKAVLDGLPQASEEP